VVDSTTGAVSTLELSGDSYNNIDRWTSDGTDIYFSSYVSSTTGNNEYKLYNMSSTGVVSELDLVSDNGSGSFIFSNYLYGLTSDGTDLFASSGSGSSMKFHRITLQQGSGGTNMVTPYTTGGESLSYVNGIEKIGDSLFALYSNKIYEIELAESWDSKNSGTTQWLYGVTFGNNTFVAVGDGGKILTSPDRTSWTAQTSGTTKDLSGVAYGNGLFVTVGNDGKIFTSDA
jgi:hypothetical protein